MEQMDIDTHKALIGRNFNKSRDSLCSLEENVSFRHLKVVRGSSRRET